MRRFTLVLVVLLLLSLGFAGIFQVILGSRGERNLPGPGVTSTP